MRTRAKSCFRPFQKEAEGHRHIQHSAAFIAQASVEDLLFHAHPTAQKTGCSEGREKVYRSSLTKALAPFEASLWLAT